MDTQILSRFLYGLRKTGSALGRKLTVLLSGLVINCNTTTFITGSALIPLGLSWWQAVICNAGIVVGNLIALAAVLANSMAGSRYHIGFPVISRSIWGMWGSQFTIWNRIFLSIAGTRLNPGLADSAFI
ncbi:NCS1 nucleoside transporter [Beauveria brongniartii RCEF 3172]|uniref:NCS1 nucleoside transporter n=1 Tax=Beauveria brongniartii RCEF 3172 TaxID=1081107 RepID=A0A166XF38_9HYPO|nr:NCS1 nucleoside transporter [Beauveria brongniartii RCEF 3172]